VQKCEKKCEKCDANAKCEKKCEKCDANAMWWALTEGANANAMQKKFLHYHPWLRAQSCPSNQNTGLTRVTARKKKVDWDCQSRANFVIWDFW
jgi:hypothetical protein